MRAIRALWSDEGAATAVEYALIVAAIAGVVIAVAYALGRKAQNLFNNTTNALP
jgi:Flp pilus assembly pilin Flp